MEPNPPLPIAPEQRLLATIVFTDVAGFSSRMQSDEGKTLKLVDRDFTTMREFAKQLSGTVLKSTGDGLLLYFTSAVHAVEWALRTQRFFAEKAKEEAADNVLKHRVGVHLGDVFMRANDVMGDGVNIAARLQAQAPAGGICISQVVYDVVKSKMKLNVVRLEERKLKNIKENIQMYHVRLEEGPAPAPAAPPRPYTPFKPAEAPKKNTGVLLLVLALVGGAGFLAWEMFKDENTITDSQAGLGALAQAAEELKKAKDLPAGGPVAKPVSPASAAIAAEEFDFLNLTREGVRNNEPALRSARESVAAMEVWRSQTLRRYNADRPLNTALARMSTAQGMTLFYDTRGQLQRASGGASRPIDSQSFAPVDQGAIILSMLNDTDVLPPREIVRGAEAFAYLHNLPEMAAALQGKRPR